MKALSVKQPWATELLGPKDIENRSWRLPTQYLGVPIALHASKQKSFDEFWNFRHLVVTKNILDASDPDSGLCVYGAIIGTIIFSRVLTLDEEKREINSPWAFGPFCWVKAAVTTCETPIPCRGSLGVWKMPDNVELEVWRQLRGKS